MLPAGHVIHHSRPTIEPDDIAAVGRVLESAMLAQGVEVRAFETEVGASLGLPGGVATSSGTAALHLALLALGVGPGDEVLIPSYTCVALLHAVQHAGARARAVDCEPGRPTMSAASAARAMSAQTKAVIVPHMFGTCAPIEKFQSLGIPIIENCAQALGALYRGRPAGSFGDVTVISFYATKLITTGEGGMLLSRSENLLAEARDRRDYDNRPDFKTRFNYKMSDVQAALGRSQLRKLKDFVQRRRELRSAYEEKLGGAGPIYSPLLDGDVPYRYVIGVRDVDRFIGALAQAGVECKRPVFQPLHHFTGDTCPKAEEVFARAVSLPLYPSLHMAALRKVATRAMEAIEQQRTASGAGVAS
jgi:perosamine synthetase